MSGSSFWVAPDAVDDVEGVIALREDECQVWCTFCGAYSDVDGDSELVRSLRAHYADEHAAVRS